MHGLGPGSVVRGQKSWDFPGSLVVKISPSSMGVPPRQKTKTLNKQYCNKFNKDSIKTGGAESEVTAGHPSQTEWRGGRVESGLAREEGSQVHR